MREARTKQAVAGLEPTFFDILIQVSGDQGVSNYVRNLIIADLLKRGLVTEQVLLQVTIGGQCESDKDLHV